MPSLRKLILEDEPVIGIRSPSDYPYLKILRHNLAFINSWPLKEIGMYEPRALSILIRCFHLFLCTTCLLGGIMYIMIHRSSLTFFEIGHMYITIFMDAVIVSRIITLTLVPNYRLVAKDFLTKIHLFFYKDNSEYAMQIHKQVHYICHLFTLYLTAEMIGCIILFNVIPMYNNYITGKYKAGGLQNSTYEHSLYYSYPFNTSTNMTGYIIACLIHWFFSYLCSNWFCMFDVFLSIMVFHLWGHFKILLHNLKNIPRPSIKSRIRLEGSNVIISTEMYSDNELLYIFKKLKEYVDYHRDIVNFTDRMSNVFGPMLFLYYMFHQASGCLLLLECSQMTADALIRYLPLTLAMFQQLIQLSVVFELVGSKSDELKNAVYGLPWECMDTKNRRVVAFFLMNVQEPVHVKAAGVANVGVTSMAAIIKASVSYFTFLRKF